MSNKYTPEQIQAIGEENHRTLIEYATNHFNEIVLDILDVARVVGYCDTEEDDYYLILKNHNGQHYRTGYRYVYSLWVGEPILLKGKIDERRYKDLDGMMAMNGCPLETEILTKLPPQKHCNPDLTDKEDPK